MSRPTYETNSDKACEEIFKKQIERIWHCQLAKTPPMHVFDFIIIQRNKVKGYIEFKRRKGKYGIYPDTILSSNKLSGVNLYFPIPVFFCVQWDDQLVYTTLRPEMWLDSELGGRTVQRRDSEDVEVVAKIPNRLFLKLLGPS